MCAQKINRFGGGAGERGWEVRSDSFQVSPCWCVAPFGDPTPRSIHDQHLTRPKREDDRSRLARRIACQQEGTIGWRLDDWDAECCGDAGGEARRRAEPCVAPWANADQHGDKLAPRRRIGVERRRPCDEWLMRSQLRGALKATSRCAIKVEQRNAALTKRAI